MAEGTTQQIAFSPEVDGPFLLGKISPQAWRDAIASELSRRLPETSARELASTMTRAPFRADAPVVTLLRRIRQHVPLVLVTNASTDLERDLETMGLTDLADHVVSSARVGVAKPDRAIYEIAAARAQVPAHRCLFVDDRAENVDAAVALGMTGVHYGGPADLRYAVDALPGEGHVSGRYQ
ncbi:Pyrimidine 5'-nucleotidase YjjG [Streptomyces sp. YIM 130001]|nr:Pyrimidine 5'-nucleotidase YjjG [Streptomyces sp. YIM 130001]